MKRSLMGLNKIKWLAAGAFMLLGLSARSQQPSVYSQYMFNMMSVNPAYAGHIQGVSSLNLLYRRQWAGIEGAPTTASLSYDSRKDSSNIGYGIQLYTDKI